MKEIEPMLATAVQHERGPEREFALEEMAVGLRVALADGAVENPANRGEIVSWETGADGVLSLIRVRWADGEVWEHLPCERDLRRV